MRGAALLCDRSLVADRLPATVVANPDAGVAVGSTEVFAQLMTFDVGASGNHGRIPVDPDHHVADVDGLITELSAFARREGVLFCSYLSERRDSNIVLGQSP